jgi:hypothetical protein
MCPFSPGSRAFPGRPGAGPGSRVERPAGRTTLEAGPGCGDHLLADRTARYHDLGAGYHASRIDKNFTVGDWAFNMNSLFGKELPLDESNAFRVGGFKITEWLLWEKPDST